VRREFATHPKHLISSRHTVPIISPTNYLESALIEVLIPENLKLFRMNTYRKYRGVGVLLLTRFPTRESVLLALSDFGEGRSIATKDLFSTAPPRLKNPLLFHQSRVNSH
jgi:hypothetical protein